MISYVFWGSDESIDKFFAETNTPAFQNVALNPEEFLKITKGEMPLIILLENGIVKNKYNYRDINDTDIIKFISE